MTLCYCEREKERDMSEMLMHNDSKQQSFNVSFWQYYRYYWVTNNNFPLTGVPPPDTSTSRPTPAPITWWKPTTTGPTTPYWQPSVSTILPWQTSATTQPSIPPWQTSATTIAPIQPVPEVHTSDKCQEGVYRRDPSNCSKYFRCVHGVEHSETCAPGLLWNDAKVRGNQLVRCFQEIVKWCVCVYKRQ